ncbi:MAG: hypothetical protein ACK5QT_06575 [Oligoflexia bacterium]
MKLKWVKKTKWVIRAGRGALLALLGILSACSSLKGLLAVEEEGERSKLIANPFGSLYPQPTYDASAPVVVRSKKGDRALEVEIPAADSAVSEWVVPISPQARATPEVRTDYANRKPSAADREIQREMPQPDAQEVAMRQDLETEMGLQAVDEDLAQGDRSYLGALDRIKSLFRERRFEAALLETEELLKEHPADPKLHAMRGTLLDRLGYLDLARQSWSQSLKLDPSNESLRRFLDRKADRLPAGKEIKGGNS